MRRVTGKTTLWRDVYDRAWAAGLALAVGAHVVVFFLLPSAQESFGVWFGEPIQRYHPPHDRRHQATALASFERGPYAFAARWELASGFPFTRPLGFDEWFDFRSSLPNVVGQYGQTRLYLDRPYNSRLPPTHRLDISAERSLNIEDIEIVHAAEGDRGTVHVTVAEGEIKSRELLAAQAAMAVLLGLGFVYARRPAAAAA